MLFNIINNSHFKKNVKMEIKYELFKKKPYICNVSINEANLNLNERF